MEISQFVFHAKPHRMLLIIAVLAFASSTIVAQQEFNAGQPVPSRNSRGASSNANNSQYFASANLLKTLFTGYLDSVPQSENEKGPLKVRIGAHVLRLLEVDELHQVLRFSVKAEIQWQDSRLKWRPEDHASLTRVEVPNSVPIWTPDVTWLERLEVDFVWRAQGRIMLENTGALTLSAQVIMGLNCYMDPAYFPFDSHKCTVTFEPLVHTKSEVELSTRMSDGIHNQSLLHDQWLFSLQTECTSQVHEYSAGSFRTEDFSKNQCTFMATRRPLYHLFNLFLPAAVITFMTVFSFLIPPTEADMKIQFSLAIMLQLIVFLMYIYDSLPISASRIPLLSVFFALCLFMVACSCVLVVLISYTHWLGEDNIEMPDVVRRIFIQKIAPFLIPYHLPALERLKVEPLKSNRVSTVSAPSIANSDRTRIGIFRLRKVNVLLDNSDDKATVKDNNGEKPADTSSSRVKFDEETERRLAPEQQVFARSHSHRTAVSESSEREWSVNKMEWSLVSLVLDRICAAFFTLVFCVVVATILIYGYRNYTPK